MKETLEKLWNEYLLEECAVIDTDEERKLTKNAIELYEKARVLLNKEQQTAIEKYVEALYDTEALFEKKAFFKGCEFAVSFILESGNLGNEKEQTPIKSCTSALFLSIILLLSVFLKGKNISGEYGLYVELEVDILFSYTIFLGKLRAAGI